MDGWWRNVQAQRSQSQDSIKFLGVVESTSACDSVNHKFNPLSHKERKALLEQIAPGMIGQYNIGMWVYLCLNFGECILRSFKKKR